MRPIAQAFFTVASLLAAPAVQAQQVRLLENEHFPTDRTEPRTFAWGDVDGNGTLDVILAESPRLGRFSGAERLFLNQGDARFVDASANLVNAPDDFTDDLVLADVDGDGDLDLWTLGVNTRLFINDGTGRFTEESAQRLPPEGLRSAKVGTALDLDGDGDLDFVRMGINDEAVLHNDGTGRFTFAGLLPFPRNLNGQRVPSYYPYSEAQGDFDGDGNEDLIYGGAPGFELFLGDGRGGFVRGSAQFPSVNAAAQDLAVGDIDGDGDPDLVAALWGNPSIQNTAAMILINAGSGVFLDVTATALPNAWPCHSVELRDLDQDGNLDLVVGLDTEPVIALGNGLGAFAVAPASFQPTESLSAIALAARDLDGDTLPDLAVASVRSGPGPSYWGNFELYHNHAGREWIHLNPTRLPRFPDATRKARFADVDLDGNVDLLRASPGGGTLLVQDGAGYFRDETLQRLGLTVTTPVIALAAADYDRDGDTDLFVGYATGPRTVTRRFFRNDGTGTFTPVVPPVAQGVLVNDAEFADVDGNGTLDIVLAGLGSELYLGDGLGGFRAASAQLPGSLQLVNRVAFADVDGDGDQDLLLAGLALTGPPRQELLLNDGTGRFSDASSRITAPPPYVRDVLFHDDDRDGDPDLLFAGPTGVELYRNDGTGSFANATASTLPANTEGAYGLALTDLDGDGREEILVARLDLCVAYRRQGSAYSVATDLLPAGVGLGATWAIGDIDRDGDTDVLLGRKIGLGSGDFGIADEILVNVDHQLHAPVAQQLGVTTRLQVFRYAPGAGPGISATCIGLASLPSRLPLPPFGELGIDPRFFVVCPLAVVPQPPGQVDLPLAMPNIPALHGVPLVAQSLVTRGASLLDARLTGITLQRMFW